MTHLDDAALDAIEQRADAATEDSWLVVQDRGDLQVWSGGEESHVALVGAHDDAEFITHARTDVPALLAAVRDAQQRAQAAEAALQRVRKLHQQYRAAGVDEFDICPECSQHPVHAPWPCDTIRALDAEQEAP